MGSCALDRHFHFNCFTMDRIAIDLLPSCQFWPTERVVLIRFCFVAEMYRHTAIGLIFFTLWQSGMSHPWISATARFIKRSTKLEPVRCQFASMLWNMASAPRIRSNCTGTVCQATSGKLLHFSYRLHTFTRHRTTTTAYCLHRLQAGSQWVPRFFIGKRQ